MLRRIRPNTKPYKTMSRYVDGFVIPIQTSNLDAYREVAERAAAIWKEYGALEYIEAVGDDLDVQEMRSFPQLAGAADGETVVFSYIVYRSREHRDEVNEKVMADPRVKEMCGPDKAPFDCKRMAYGGFKSIVEA
jgi:uncharacterized protein YbaA (DUF1428 family)